MVITYGKIDDFNYELMNDTLKLSTSKKEYIFCRKQSPSLYDVHEVCQKGDGLLINLPDDLSILSDEKGNYSRIYFFFNQPFTDINITDEDNNFVSETHQWLIKHI